MTSSATVFDPSRTDIRNVVLVEAKGALHLPCELG
jgi:hypothetical protein